MGKALRDYYGEALLKYGSDERVVVLDSDVSGSTKSKILEINILKDFSM